MTHDRRRQPFDMVISVEHPCDESVTLEQGRAPRLAVLDRRWTDRQLILTCYDIETAHEDTPAPDRALVEAALAHFEKYKQKDLTRVLVHCRSGKARSTALGLVLLRHELGPGSEEQALKTLLKVRSIAAPNLAIVQHGDDVLGCNGALVRVVENDPDVSERRAKANLARAHQIESRRAAKAAATVMHT
jgi:predicted protein tyrosine phosphatase